MDEIDLMRGIGADVPVDDSEAKAMARIRLQSRIAREPQPSTSNRGAGNGRTRRGVLAAASLGALVVIAILIQAVLPPGGGGPGVAQATLSELAAKAELVDQVPPLAHGQYFYVQMNSELSRTQTNISLGLNWTYIVPVQREKWLATDGSGRILERFGRPRLASPDDRRAWVEAGSPALLPHGHEVDSPFGPGELAPRDLGALPRDPRSLAALISAGGAVGTADEVHGDPLATIGDLLGEAPATADLRSALFNATAQLPGIATTRGVRDPDGRAGIAVSLVRDGVLTELIFDPSSSALLAVTVTKLDDQGQPLQILERSTYEVRRTVDSVEARPLKP